MNLMGKISGSSSSTGEDHKQQIHPLFSSSSSFLPYHHHHQLLSPPPYHHHQGGEPSSNHDEDLAEETGGGCTMIVEREHMFDKVVTPSDVGKLNRLVIPKQHAERYFPLDTSANDKGLLLNFEDRNGKLWRFRYSYWNSSQSYVMTKGWSRFVKDKKLDAGDVVSFQRGVGVTAKDRLFIDWKRRVSNPPLSNPSFPFYNNNNNHNFIGLHPWKPFVLQSLHPATKNPNLMLQSSNSNPNSRSVYLGSGCGFGAPQQRVGFYPPAVTPIRPVVNYRKASGKRRLRLFGVNMDCVLSEDEEDDIINDEDYFQPSALIPSSTTSSSFSTIPYLQLRPNYGEGGADHECNQITSTLLLSSSSNSSSAAHDFNITAAAKSTASNMSLDLKI